MKKSKATIIKVNCSVCNREIERLLSQYNNCKNRCKGIYQPVCSTQCSKNISRKKDVMITLICETCQKPFERSQLIIETKKHNNYNHHFCTRKCATIFRNKNQEKTDVPQISKIIKNTEYYLVTKGDIFISSKDWRSARCSIQRHAKKISLKNKDKFNSCQMCGYDKHVQVCHIKSVSDFDDNALITDINAITNLMALCPNHHWEYDHNLLDTDYNSSPGGK